MGNKAHKAAQAATTQAAPAAPAPALVLVVGKPPRIAGHTATKNGTGGTAGTWAAIAAHMAANNGSITLPTLQAICTAQGDAAFARYAMGKQRQWLVPQG